jgi:L-seryl-tRNA(Ser) seleniumtransferase
VVEDAGSGYLSGALEIRDTAFRDEPVIAESIAAGAGAVMFSGDKLLCGPQSGVIVGQEALLARIRMHPLMRALRVDKMTYAALEATLEEYAAGRAQSTVPVAAMIAMPLDAIERRARVLATTLNTMGIRASVVDGESTIGGGSAPGSTLPTKLVAIEHSSAQQTERWLRERDVPIIARIDNDRVVLDLRTVDPDDDRILAAAFQSA